MQDPFDIAVVAGPADVVQDLVLAALAEGPADAAADVVEGVVPGDPLPLAGPAGAAAAQWVQDALGVVDLVQRRGTLGAVPSPAGGMMRIALQLVDLAGLFVDPGDQTAVGLTVEARRRDELEAARDALGPGSGVVHLDVVPGGRIGIAGETLSGWTAGVGHGDRRSSGSFTTGGRPDRPR
jgi:hypothetical protein